MTQAAQNTSLDLVPAPPIRDVIELLEIGEAPDYETLAPALAEKDREGANRHLGWIRRIEDQLSDEGQAVAAVIQRYTDWLGARIEGAQRAIAWHEDVLDRYHRAVYGVDDRLKTLKMPNGELRLRAQQAEWFYRADDAEPDEEGEIPEDVGPFVLWAAEHKPDLVAPVTIKVRCAYADNEVVRERLAALHAEGLIEEPEVSPAAPDKAAVKKALVKKDDAGKKVLALGVVPESMEKPPGLVVVEREPKFDYGVARGELEEPAQEPEREYSTGRPAETIDAPALGPACACMLVRAGDWETPAEWEQNPDCPVHGMKPAPADDFTGEPF